MNEQEVEHVGLLAALVVSKTLRWLLLLSVPILFSFPFVLGYILNMMGAFSPHPTKGMGDFLMVVYALCTIASIGAFALWVKVVFLAIVYRIAKRDFWRG